MSRSLCWPCTFGRCAWCTGCSCACGSRASIATRVAHAVILLAIGVFLIVVSVIPPAPKPAAEEHTWHTRPATAEESRQHQLDQQAAQLIEDMRNYQGGAR